MPLSASSVVVQALLSVYVGPEHVSGAENRAERAKTRVERSGEVSGSQKNRAERERERIAERERSGERTINLPLQRPLRPLADILLFSLSSRDTN